jgi:hypothetical protein
VFALSDSPSIESGDRKMTFAWGGSNGERLFAHSESITAANNSNNHTTASSTSTTATSGQSWTTLGFPLKHNAEVSLNTHTQAIYAVSRDGHILFSSHLYIRHSYAVVAAALHTNLLRNILQSI